MFGENLRAILSHGELLAGWAVLSALSVAVVVHDLRRNNAHIAGLMKAVWVLTVLYSGPLGLLIYYYAGRKEIPNNSIWRKGFRSVAHCYSGCGAGEVTGVTIAAGLLVLGNWGVALTTLAFAYLFGYAMTFGPMVQEGVPVKEAAIDTFYSDTATIAAMEVTAIGVDLWLASEAVMGDVLFWTSLIVSLTVGLVAAYPVNLLLIALGVKGGMGDPRDTESTGHAH